MQRERWRRIEEVFGRAIELDPEARDAFLDEACADDAELRERVERLLFHDHPQTDRIRVALADTTTELLDEAPIGEPRRIGPYRIIQRLGVGGMGEVYEAEQDEPIRRVVALKLIKPGMDTRDVIARFESERQALALMNHSNIARVHDAGATERGRPYFVMERVAGEPLTRYCDRHRMSMRRRIELFLQVCDGVQHAHQKGVIHRDLKPSNILVAEENDRPVPKIIDFGVAKATSGPLTDQPAHTLVGVGIGTPEYMSPEQVGRSGLDVDTRTDVYALGVVFYQLLSGALPFDSAKLRAGGMDRLREMICEEEAPTPSRRLSTLAADESTQVARARGTDGPSLHRTLRGELDWITMKAMDKDRARRYASPDALAADIRRFLRHEPVLAGPPSSVYRARKFVRRHLAGVSTGTVVALALILGTIGASIGTVRAQQAERLAVTEARTAQEVLDFLVALFRESDPSYARGESVTAREVLDRGARQIDATLGGQPVVQARLLHTIGLVYQELGLYDDAEPVLEDAFAIRRVELGEDDPDTLSSMSDLAYLLYMQSRPDEAKLLQDEAFRRREQLLGGEHPDTLRSLERLALLDRAERPDVAEARFAEVLETRRHVQGDNHPDTVRTMSRFAWFYWSNHRAEEARPLAREAARVSAATLGEDHPESLHALAVLAAMIETEVESEELYHRALEGHRRILGGDHPATLNTAYELAVTSCKTGRHEQAVEILVPVVESSLEVLGDERWQTGLFMNGLGRSYHQSGRYEKSAETLGRLVDRARELGGPDAGAIYARNLALLQRDAGRLDEAEALYRDLLERSRRVNGPNASWTARLTAELGSVHEHQGRLAEAESRYREAIELREGADGGDPSSLMWSRAILASFWLDRGRSAEAAGAFREVVDFGRQLEGNRGERFLGEVYEDGLDPLWGLALAIRHTDPFESEQLFRESLELKRTIHGEESPLFRYHQARYEVLHGDRDAAVEHLQAALDGGFGINDVLVGPGLDPLRNDPAFFEMLERARSARGGYGDS